MTLERIPSAQQQQNRRTDDDAPDVIVVTTDDGRRTPTQTYDTDNGDPPTDDIQETGKDRSKRRLVDVIKFNDLYIRKYWDGRLKALEGLSTLIACLLLPPDYQYYHPRFIFFRFITATCVIFVTIDLLLHLSSLWQRLPKFLIMSNVLMLFNILAAMALAACCTLVVGVAEFSGASESDTLTACVAGFAAMLFFGMESFLHLIRYRTSSPMAAYAYDGD